MIEPADTIICVDCGGRAHLLTAPRPDPPAWEEGDIVAYRCEDCLDRWDLVLALDDDHDTDDQGDHDEAETDGVG